MAGVYGSYISTEAFCIIFSVILLFRLKSGLGSEQEVRILRSMFLWYIVLLVTDMLWALMEDNILLLPRLVNAAVNAAADISVTWGCCLWFRFVAERSGLSARFGKKWKVILSVPAFVIAALLIVSVFTGWMFFIDGGNHYRETKLVDLRICVNYFYLLLASLLSVYKTVRAGSRQERREYLGFILFVLITIPVSAVEEKYPQWPLAELLVFLALLILYLTVYVDRENDLLKQREELTSSRMEIMRSQIQPHFLYNALSVVVYYCDTDPQQAKQTTLVFSAYLRENLDSLIATEAVPFEKELAHVKNYLFLEKQRFEDRLNVVYDIQATDFRLPFISVQPLAEDAVCRGVFSSKSGVNITVSARGTEECFEVSVQDDCGGTEQDETIKNDPQRSINNIRSRVSKLSGGTLIIESVPGGGTCATIRIPKERGLS